MATVHLIRYGAPIALCEFTAEHPRSWPEGNAWIGVDDLPKLASLEHGLCEGCGALHESGAKAFTKIELADFMLLSSANEKGKFGLVVGQTEPIWQAALERCFDANWVRLIDLSPLPAFGPGLFRIFQLTAEGWYRLATLQGRNH